MGVTTMMLGELGEGLLGVALIQLLVPVLMELPRASREFGRMDGVLG
jgi:hypothetical protein